MIPDQRYKVTKTVTEYHVFHIMASSMREALECAEDNVTLYCDTDNAIDTVIEVQSVVVDDDMEGEEE